MNEANCNNANERAQFGDRFRKLFRRKPKAKASTKRRESYLKKVNITEHKIPIEQFAAFLKTDLVNGLTDSEAEERLARNGLNQFTPPETTPEWIKFLKKLFYGFSALLWISLILCLVIFGVADDWSQVTNLSFNFVLRTQTTKTVSFVSLSSFMSQSCFSWWFWAVVCLPISPNEKAAKSWILLKILHRRYEILNVKIDTIF